ncbi:MAG: hypothetical protein K0R69_2719 [Clostridia bacterium]|jgi:hypothetical protein|nr:hypothetical protein [Clostridia bacterium]
MANNSKCSADEAILPVLFGFLIRIQSLNKLKFRLKGKDFKNIIEKAKENKLLRNGLNFQMHSQQSIEDIYQKSLLDFCPKYI